MAEFNATVRAFRKRKRLILVAAKGLLAARRQYPNNRTFHRWLKSSSYADLSGHDRAALIQIGRHEKRLRGFLATTGIAAPSLLWKTARKTIIAADGGPAS
ncbi:hypothetical protein CP49_18070 [Bradyrhizobium valentinum]|uniref:Uncharacterized protein n=2 Tax=Bradyrhizobium valentinum TaxID=1518501 RepID=A0A0R3M390_9BRAD|nr:hypothetical protein CP49_18070 [Bradyrhizobium valentinum]